LTVERRTFCPGTNLSNPFKGLRALPNKLFSGDCLEVMRTLTKECRDLICLDPSFTPMPPKTCCVLPLVGTEEEDYFFLGHLDHKVGFQISQDEEGIHGSMES